jgi:hypothetical protein
LDGENFDRDIIRERFSAISGRSPYALRDFSNYRDEFGAYGTYLGLFRIEWLGGNWKILLSNATKYFLCSNEPDVESFCRTQLALFQYPNCAGAAQNATGNVRMQANVLRDTSREIANGIRINPLRLICKCFVALHEINKTPLSSVYLSYRDIFMLMNDDRVNQVFSPDEKMIASVLHEYKHTAPPAWVNENGNLTKFKRNFHILEWTGLFMQQREKHNITGIKISANNIHKAYSYITAISQMNQDYLGFEKCYNNSDVSGEINRVAASAEWGRYFDSLTMPIQSLTSLSDDIEAFDISFAAPPIGTIPPIEQPFPSLKYFQSNRIRAFVTSGIAVDPYETLIRREKANREHTRILARLASLLRYKGYSVFENTFIDLYADANGQQYIFEVKSNNARNALSQIRKAIAQLYEYRYRSHMLDAVLCIVLQEKPLQEWIIDFLLNDRGILLCWLVDEMRIECPAQCYKILADIGVLG